MNILVIGAGMVGTSLAEELSNGNHNVSVIDVVSSRCDSLTEKMDVMAVCGSGSTPSVLEQAGIREMDMVIAVTNSDDVNIVVCSLSRIYGVQRRIARLRNNELSSAGASVDISKLGVTRVIAPERVAADNILQYIDSPGTTDSANFGSGDILIRGYKILGNMPVANKSVKEIREMAEPHILLVVAIIRDGSAIIPRVDDVIMEGDEVFTIFPRSSLETYLKMVNYMPKQPPKVVVFGDSQIAVNLAQSLETMQANVLFVDPDESHGRKIADMLNNVEIQLGDCTDLDVLREIRVENADFFIAANKKREDNIMAALLAASEGAKEVIAVYHNPRHAKLFNSIGIDHVICMHTVTTQEIMEEVNQGQIGSTIGRAVNIEAIRLIAGKKSRITGKPLSEVWKRIREGAIIGIVVRDNIMHIPQGSDIIETGDDVIVITNGKHTNVIKELFKAR